MIEIDILPASSETKGGDSVLIRVGNFNYNGEKNHQSVMLIDGGYSENAERIQRHLNSHYRTKFIDAAIITHPDMDHLSGFNKLLANDMVHVRKTYIHDPWLHTKTIFARTEDGRRTVNSIGNKFEDTLRLLSSTLDMIDPINDEPFGLMQIGGFNAYILGPTKRYYQDLLYHFPGMEGYKGHSHAEIYEDSETDYSPFLEHFLENPKTSPKNNSSAITLLHDSNDTPIALFTGDAGVEAISLALDIADRNRLAYKNVKLFQIPHHGSIKNISEDIIKRISPRTAYVSAPPSKEEHPSPLLLNYLHSQGINVRHIKDKDTMRFPYEGAPNRPGWTTVPNWEPYKKVKGLRNSMRNWFNF